jgi:hypothetical protein
MSKVPCGTNMGHGASCTIGYLCDACHHIEEQQAQVERVRALLKVAKCPDGNCIGRLERRTPGR